MLILRGPTSHVVSLKYPGGHSGEEKQIESRSTNHVLDSLAVCFGNSQTMPTTALCTFIPRSLLWALQTVGAAAAPNKVNSESKRVQNITQKLGNTNPSDVSKNKRTTD